MNLDVVISRLKALVPMFNGNVAGAAEYELGVHNQAWLPLPAAYVVPLDDEAHENTNMSGIQQTTIERIGVIVVFSNAAAVAAGDRRGQTATDLYNPTRWQLFTALLNWRANSSDDNPGLILPTDPGADHSYRGMFFSGGKILGFDLARLTYQWDFGLEVLLTDADGSWPPLPNTLNEVWIAWIKEFLVGRSEVGKQLETVLATEDIQLP